MTYNVFSGTVNPTHSQHLLSLLVDVLYSVAYFFVHYYAVWGNDYAVWGNVELEYYMVTAQYAINHFTGGPWGCKK